MKFSNDQSAQGGGRQMAPNEGSVLFIGNATVLIRYGGFTILTDPTFIHQHEQVSIGYGMHSVRLTNPAMDISALPPLDLIVLSHFHGDHFDQVAERELDRSYPIVTTPEAAKKLNERGFARTTALTTWSSTAMTKGDMELRITSMPGRHGPPLANLVLPAVMGSMLEFQSPRHQSIPSLSDRRHADLRRFKGDSPTISGRGPGLAPFGRHAGVRSARHHGCEAGRRDVAIDPSPTGDSDSLQRLRRVHVAVVGFPTGGQGGGMARPGRVPDSRRVVSLPRAGLKSRGVATATQDRWSAPMATDKQRAAARRNIIKAAKAAKRKRTIARLPKRTRARLGQQGAKAAAQSRRKAA